MIHNISIATDDDVIQFGDDVNIYPVYLPSAIIICGNCPNWLEKTIFFDNFLLADLGTHLWPLSVYLLHKNKGLDKQLFSAKNANIFLPIIFSIC